MTRQEEHEQSADRPGEIRSRARGALLGQLAGDALGGLVEFQSPERIAAAYPKGVRRLQDGGTWGTIAGQPTDDSEMALALARLLADEGRYDRQQALEAYRTWLDSGPFDCGNTIAGALTGMLNPHSQANGAMMRISPLGIFGAAHSLEDAAAWAESDAGLTHPHPVCRQAGALYVMAVAHAVRTGCSTDSLYRQIANWARRRHVDPALADTVAAARHAPPADYLRQQGWVLIAFGNALWQLLHASTLEEGVV
ncbi:MAG: ADP-ribosylglycohydrolase family protein, partial [Synergistales bacterium]|nr:ADP-ribosylglycohydrolase family protein [Synergistales bacterium]